jgi:hypothetical protein
LTSIGHIHRIGILCNASAILSTNETISTSMNRVGCVVTVGVTRKTSTIAHFGVIVKAEVTRPRSTPQKRWKPYQNRPNHSGKNKFQSIDVAALKQCKYDTARKRFKTR